MELAEIEVVLSTCPGVRKIVVVAKDRNDGGTASSTSSKAIVAYVIPDRGAGSGVAPSDLRAFARARLPDYMCPAAYMFVESFPLTPSGKVDRKSLPAPDFRAVDAERGEVVAPRTSVETAVHAIWCGVLKVDPSACGVYDSFFESGGHSLSATQVLSRVNVRFGTALSVAQLYDTPTVAAVAAAVEAHLATVGDDAEAQAETVAPDDTNDHGLLSYNQQSMWFESDMTPEAAVAYNICFAVSFERGDAIDADRLRAALRAVITAHPALRTRYLASPAGPRQEVVASAEPDFEVITATGDDDEMAALMGDLSAYACPLESGRLLRVRLVVASDNGDCGQTLHFNVHHIAVDLWSLVLVMRDLDAAYADPEAFLAARAAAAAQGSATYASYAVWQQRLLSRADGRRQEEYWRGVLANCPVLELATDYPRPPRQTYAGDLVEFEIGADAAAALARLASSHNVTLYTVLLTAYAVLLHKYTLQERVVVGSPMSGRTDPAYDQTVGYFINMVPLAIDLVLGATVADHLAAVRSVVVGALSNQDFPFPLMVERSAGARDPSRSPLFQVAFVLQKTQDALDDAAANNALASLLLNNGGVGVKVCGAAGVSRALPHHSSQFDLTLVLGEAPDGSLTGTLEYNVALFDRSTAERMARHFANVAEGMGAAPNRTIGAVSLLDPTERDLVVYGLNETELDFGSWPTVAEALASHADDAALAGKPAVVDGEVSVSYARLGELSAQIAHFLRGPHGLQPDDVVACWFHRSWYSVVAYAGIMTAGTPVFRVFFFLSLCLSVRLVAVVCVSLVSGCLSLVFCLLSLVSCLLSLVSGCLSLVSCLLSVRLVVCRPVCLQVCDINGKR